jgi:hypothetical protein
MKHEEDAIQRLIVNVLRMRGKTVFAIPNGGRRDKREAARMKAAGVMAGVADLCVLLKHGRTLWMEVKTPKGKVSPAQRDFETLCERNGHLYCVVRSAYDAVFAVEEAER